MKVTLANGRELQCENQPFTSGGQADLYWDKAGTHVIKLYQKPDPTIQGILKKVIEPQYNVVLGNPHWDELFAWPKDIIVKPRLGLTMLRAPKGTMDLLWFLGPKTREVVIAKHGVQKLGTWANYLSLSIKMARVVRLMHYRGLCHSDLSFRNFLVDPPNNKVVLLDCDSLVVKGFLPPQVIGTPGCMAPELAAQFTSPGNPVYPSAQTDLHALPTLIYRLLFRRHPLEGPKCHSADPAEDEALAMGERALFIEDPNDRSNHPSNLRVPYTSMFTPEVQNLVERAFVEGLHNPDRRPDAAQWERFLARMADAMVPCSGKSCPLGAFVLLRGKPVRCPACNTPLQNPPSLPLFNFYRPQRGREGKYNSDLGYYMVAWPGRTLHNWHVDPSQSPGPETDSRPRATIEYDHRARKWHLKNADLPELQFLGDQQGSYQTISPSQKVELLEGTRLLLGPKQDSRLVVIQMISLP